ncbi:unnamed protein product [Trichobilharzia szidati]|nr:unnamed protein product [Trichobilharzia szidati]
MFVICIRLLLQIYVIIGVLISMNMYQLVQTTGYFLCVVETAKICHGLCQQLGCNDRYFMGVIPSKSDKIKRNYRCRCFPEYHVCFYNPLPKKIYDID